MAGSKRSSMEDEISGEKTCILVCDVQGVFMRVCRGSEGLVRRAQFVLEAGVLLGCSIQATEQYPEKLGETVEELRGFVSESAPGVLNGPVGKKVFSMLVPEVVRSLHEHGIKSALLMGVEAHVCILQTARDLIREGIRPIVLLDAISSQRPFDRSVAIKRLRDMGATISTCESAIFELTRSAEHRNFKAISKLVRQLHDDDIEDELTKF